VCGGAAPLKINTMVNENLRLRRGIGLGLLCLAAALVVVRHQHRHVHVTAADAVAGQFDYYLLALSWSPTYCLTHREDQAQCGSKGFGFVLHGLWPQFTNGGYPENCAVDASLSPAARKSGESLYPSPKLVAHEWQRHGTCSGMNALEYFRTADRALAAVQVPGLLQAPRAQLSLSAAEIRAAFHAANPRLPADGMVVSCRGAELAEVRVCLSSRLELISCGHGVRSSCPAAALQVPAVR
jgi:ribonuclease T2